MTKPILPFLETMITQVCNLSCQGCTNFSDLKHSGYVSWEQGHKWLTPWVDRITIEDFGIMGGEPLINPEWQQWVLGVRAMLPNAQIRFTTNGLLLHRYPDIVDFFEAVGNVVFKITLHHETEQVKNSVEQIFNARPWQSVTEFGIARWKHNNIKLQINKPKWFYQTFRGSYSNMLPHDTQPADAFESCVQKTCPLLYNGKIYKCSTSALTPETIKQQSPHTFDQWRRYIDTGLSPTCTQQNLNMFLSNFGKPNTICAQCPTSVDLDSRLDHKITVSVK